MTSTYYGIINPHGEGTVKFAYEGYEPAIREERSAADLLRDELATEKNNEDLYVTELTVNFSPDEAIQEETNVSA